MKFTWVTAACRSARRRTNLKDDHAPIIDRETWEKAQAILARRQERIEHAVFPRDGVHFLYGKIFCGNCGAPYKRRTMTNRHKSGDERHYKAWNCKERQKGKNGNHCQNPIIQETKLLEQISQKLGWEWNGPDHFDAERFRREAAREEVMSDGNIVGRGSSRPPNKQRSRGIIYGWCPGFYL